MPSRSRGEKKNHHKKFPAHPRREKVIIDITVVSEQEEQKTRKT